MEKIPKEGCIFSFRKLTCICSHGSENSALTMRRGFSIYSEFPSSFCRVLDILIEQRAILRAAHFPFPELSNDI